MVVNKVTHVARLLLLHQVLQLLDLLFKFILQLVLLVHFSHEKLVKQRYLVLRLNLLLEAVHQALMQYFLEL